VSEILLRLYWRRYSLCRSVLSLSDTYNASIYGCNATEALFLWTFLESRFLNLFKRR
jgi:hypothetical protein